MKLGVALFTEVHIYFCFEFEEYDELVHSPQILNSVRGRRDLTGAGWCDPANGRASHLLEKW
jgi:hypothetical protein